MCPEFIETRGKPFLTYPENLDMDDFYGTDPKEMFMAISYCLKDLECPAGRFTGSCDPECSRCCISRVLELCKGLGITAGIYTDGSGVERHLKENAGKYKWIIGLSCPYEINTLCAPYRERFGNNQLLFPIHGDHCRSEQDRKLRRGRDSRIQLLFEPEVLYEVLEKLSRKLKP
jgi:hypothetical protein